MLEPSTTSALVAIDMCNRMNATLIAALNISLLLFSITLSLNKAALAEDKTGKIQICEGIMEYQYDHLDDQYDTLWTRNVAIKFGIIIEKDLVKFSKNGWQPTRGLIMSRLPMIGYNVLSIHTETWCETCDEIGTDYVASFLLSYDGDFTFTKNGITGIETSRGKCRDVSYSEN